MECQWGLEGCLNLERCYLCTSEGLHYKTKQRKRTQLAHRQAKINDRAGSGFEYRNNQNNNELLSGATSRQTPNSGAGQVKGDEEIRGIIKVMEELKEQNKTTSRGEKTFSIQKEWLLKLRREASAAGKEFWYLKFVFAKDDRDVFTILDSDMVMSMVYSMVEDRKAKYKAEADLDVAEKRRRLIEVENTKLLAEIDLLKAEIKRLKPDFDLEALI